MSITFYQMHPATFEIVNGVQWAYSLFSITFLSYVF